MALFLSPRGRLLRWGRPAERTERRILELLAEGPKSGRDLWDGGYLSGMLLASILEHLEAAGVVEVVANHEDYPWRRVYRMTGNS